MSQGNIERLEFNQGYIKFRIPGMNDFKTSCFLVVEPLREGGGVKPPKPPRLFSFDVFAVHERDYYSIPGRVGYSGIIVEDMQ